MITRFRIFENLITDIKVLKNDNPVGLGHKLANVNNIKKEIKYWPPEYKIKETENYTIKYTNLFHREDGPAVQRWYDNRQKHVEIYYKLGKKHREDGPASLEWFPNNQIKYIMYFIDDKCHREDGPAFQSFNINGQLERNEYYLNGNLYEVEEWLKKLKEMNSPYYEDQLLKYTSNKYNI